VHITKAINKVSIFSNETMVNLQHATTREYYLQRHSYILEKLDGLSYDENLKAIRPYDIFCDSRSCPAVDGTTALYFDDDHLSLAGAELLAREILKLP
ncbi:MAG: acyltransferase, partial [Gammaproteobacteria bacterium]|nr:acyltransferase [Gammaproteobacteria bacterium]